MTKVTITHKLAGHQVGDTLETSTKAAQYLVDAGYADALTDDEKPKRGRPSKADTTTD
jgi:hypothetical protein